MNPISMAINGVSLAIDLAQRLINAFSRDEEERQAHIADLKGRLKIDQGDVHSTAEEAKRLAAALPDPAKHD